MLEDSLDAWSHPHDLEHLKHDILHEIWVSPKQCDSRSWNLKNKATKYPQLWKLCYWISHIVLGGGGKEVGHFLFSKHQWIACIDEWGMRQTCPSILINTALSKPDAWGRDGDQPLLLLRIRPDGSEAWWLRALDIFFPSTIKPWLSLHTVLSSTLICILQVIYKVYIILAHFWQVIISVCAAT